MKQKPMYWWSDIFSLLDSNNDALHKRPMVKILTSFDNKNMINICDTIKGVSHMLAIFTSVFQYESQVHFKCYILIQTPLQSDIW